MLRRFGVGMAPSAWDQVLTGSQRAGFKVDELLAAGLIQKGRQGGHYDRFRSRITFPIRDQRGRVLGFGARALSPDSKPKYLNSPEGELYRKSHTLYGIDRARGPIAKARRAIVVEGYTDVLALHQAGVEEAVAIMGTAITPEQITMLAGLTESVVLALDADRAGADAMIRAQKVAGGKSLELRVAAMPEGEDPADMLKEGSVDRFMKLVEEAVDLPSFRVDVALGRGDLGSACRAGAGAGGGGAGAEGDGGDGARVRRAGSQGGGPAGHRCEPGAGAGALGAGGAAPHRPATAMGRSRRSRSRCR